MLPTEDVPEYCGSVSSTWLFSVAECAVLFPGTSHRPVMSCTYDEFELSLGEAAVAVADDDGDVASTASTRSCRTTVLLATSRLASSDDVEWLKLATVVVFFAAFKYILV